jgi:transposase
VNGRFSVIKTFGSAVTTEGINELLQQARQALSNLQRQTSLFASGEEAYLKGFLQSLSNGSVQVIGPELVFGRIYDAIGFNKIDAELFRHLVIARLAFPLSKLKTIDYLLRFRGIQLKPSTVYRFLDKVHNRYKDQAEQIAFNHTRQLLGGTVSMVFYDMTTLYFEAADEDDLRRTGFSKEGKHQNPQIYIGLLVGLGGYAIGYDIFEGNIYEGHTLIPFLQKMEKRFNIGKPVVVADAGLLSNANITVLQQQQYQFIIGARLKNESKAIKEKLQQRQWKDGDIVSFTKGSQTLYASFSDSRAAKDEHNRKRGLLRLERQIKAGKLTKANINNKGYNKYLRMKGELTIEIDYERYTADKCWDGLKGYLTNTKLTGKQVMENYNNLWQVEKAFRMSKTDLRIRPIYHRLADRIAAHICISFVAYAVYKELERVLKKSKATLSLQQAAEQTQNMYQLKVSLPDTKTTQIIQLQMTEKQAELIEIIKKNF